MIHLQRLVEVWSLLPAFRVVAETEHLPTASKKLGLTPSALSRSIRLLEDRLGLQVFDRAGRDLRLNDSGRALLESARHAMRLVDNALDVIKDQPLRGPIQIAMAGDWATSAVIPAVQALTVDAPGLVPTLLIHPVPTALPMLVHGAIDLLFHEEPAIAETLTSQIVGQTSRSVYRRTSDQDAVGSPLRAKSLEDVAFVAPPPLANGMPADGWPTTHRRRTSLVVAPVAERIDTALRGPFAIVLPDVVAARFCSEGRLVRLPFDIVPPVTLFATRRTPLGPSPRIDAVMTAVNQFLHNQSLATKGPRGRS